MRFNSSALHLLLGTVIVAITISAVEAQPPSPPSPNKAGVRGPGKPIGFGNHRPKQGQVGGPGGHGGRPVVENPTVPKKWYVWGNISRDRAPHDDHFEAMVVHVRPDSRPNKPMLARIWLYEGKPTTPGKAKLRLVEKYLNVPITSIKPQRANALSNLAVTVDVKCLKNTNSPPSKRLILLTGTQSPGGALDRKPMLRVTTFVRGVQYVQCPQDESNDAPEIQPAIRHTVGSGCEDYPDDEMLEEWEYDYEYDESEDPPLEDYEYEYDEE